MVPGHNRWSVRMCPSARVLLFPSPGFSSPSSFLFNSPPCFPHSPPISFSLSSIQLTSTAFIFFPVSVQSALTLRHPNTAPTHGSLSIPRHPRANEHRPPTSNDMSCVRISSPTHPTPSPRWQDGRSLIPGLVPFRGLDCLWSLCIFVGSRRLL